jgi:hypothetical protein
VALLLWLFLRFSRKQEGGDKMRPLMNAWQYLSVVLMTEQDWPPVVTWLQNEVLQILNVDVVGLASPACLGLPMNYYARFGCMVAMCVAVIGCPWLVSYALYKCRHKDAATWKRAKTARLHDTVMLVLLVYTTITAQALFHFRCLRVDGSDGQGGTSTTSYLMVDYSLKCYDSQWYAMLALVLAVLVLFSVGLPVASAIVLWQKGGRVLKTDKDVKLMWGVLYLPYRPAAYLYESVAMLFKLLLLTALVFFGQGTLYQLAAVLLVTFMRV